MKRIVSLFLILISITVMLSVFCSCGAKSASDGEAYTKTDEASAEEAKMYSIGIGSDSASSESENSTETEDAGDSSSSAENDLANRKIVKTVNMNAQTTEYDNFISDLKALVNQYGGFVEQSQMYNRESTTSYRSSSFTLRIPTEKLESFTEGIQNKATVTYYNESADDVTMAYIDIESRIKSLQTELDRLEEIVATASDINYILEASDKIADVRYELENYQSQLRKYDELISYSTVTIDIKEVERVIENTEKQGTWEQIITNLENNLYIIGQGFKALFIFFVSGLPFFAIIGAIAVIVVLIVKFSTKKKKK